MRPSRAPCRMAPTTAGFSSEARMMRGTIPTAATKSLSLSVRPCTLAA
jgi:hypothetical protein